MEEYKKQFIDFMLAEKAFRVGEFILKSGRKSPYFVNTGMFDDGGSIGKLGYFYASRIMDEGIGDFEIIFGPAYKGIPLAVATGISLAKDFGKNVGYAFDRKEAKTHGDEAAGGKKIIVGRKISDGDSVVLIDDVFTTGGTKYETIELLNSLASGLSFPALVIAVDRLEANERGGSNIAEFTDRTGIPVISIVNIREIIGYLKSTATLPEEDEKRFKTYLERYGVKQ